VPSGIAITGQQSTGVYINYNTFNHWRQRAIYVVARQKPHSNINIVRNRINPPLKGTIKQPIAFQRTASSRGATNVDIVENNMFGGKVPHLKKGVTFNNGTADSVSLHEVSNFKISSNCITNGGEVGIVVVRGSKNGEIRNNRISDVDMAGIYIGDRSTPPTRVTNILVIDNSIINAGRNRDQEKKAEWARAGISIDTASNIRISNNTIRETAPLYYSRVTPRKSHSMVYGMYIKKGAGVNIVKNNKYNVSATVQKEEIAGKL